MRIPPSRRGVTIGIIGLALIVIVYQLWPSGSGGVGNMKAYYTADDGKTYFADEMRTEVPFDKDGKQAVRAYVFKCGDGEPFVGYMERLTEEGQKAVAESKSQNPQDPGAMVGAVMGYHEMKRPEDKQWTNVSDQQGMVRVTNVQCPQASDKPVAVRP